MHFRVQYYCRRDLAHSLVFTRTFVTISDSTCVSLADGLLFFHHDRVLTVAFCSFQVVFLVVLFVAVVSAQFGDFYGGEVYGPGGIQGFAPFAASVRDPRQNTGKLYIVLLMCQGRSH